MTVCLCATVPHIHEAWGSCIFEFWLVFHWNVKCLIFNLNNPAGTRALQLGDAQTTKRSTRPDEFGNGCTNGRFDMPNLELTG